VTSTLAFQNEPVLILDSNFHNEKIRGDVENAQLRYASQNKFKSSTIVTFNGNQPSTANQLSDRAAL